MKFGSSNQQILFKFMDMKAYNFLSSLFLRKRTRTDLNLHFSGTDLRITTDINTVSINFLRFPGKNNIHSKKIFLKSVTLVANTENN